MIKPPLLHVNWFWSSGHVEGQSCSSPPMKNQNIYKYLSCSPDPRTKYGHPMKPFFHWNSELLGLGRTIGQINSGAFEVFSADLSTPILVQWVPCPCFPLFNHYFYKKLSLYIIHIPNIYLGLGVEFGLLELGL